jgi:hypothetical protein
VEVVLLLGCAILRNNVLVCRNTFAFPAFEDIRFASSEAYYRLATGCREGWNSVPLT